MIKYLYCHGFGFSAGYWKNFTPLLIPGEKHLIDLGYFNSSTNEDLFQDFYTKNSFKVGIGHSLGLMKLINLGINFDLLIGINAFANFFGNTDLYHKRVEEHSILLKHFKINPTQTLKNFYKRCKLKAPLNDLSLINTTTLVKDLKFLLNKITFPLNIPILIINSLDDIIVPHALTLDNFASLNNVNLKLLPQGGHSLIINSSQETATLINNFITNYV